MDLYSSASTQRPEELSGGATLPPPNTAIAEQQVLEQTIAERVVPELQAPSASALGPQTEVLGQAGDDGAPKLPEQLREALGPEGQHQPAPENQEQPSQPQKTKNSPSRPQKTKNSPSRPQSSNPQNLQRLMGPPRSQLEVLDQGKNRVFSPSHGRNHRAL
jgi:hypothetical protein